MFLNLSNHASMNWSESQRAAAEKWGEIVDLNYPNVNPYATSEEITSLAEELEEKILSMKPDIIMCQGEFTLAYSVIRRVRNHGIPVVAACSQRNVEETIENGVVKKNVIFEFCGFREYE